MKRISIMTAVMVAAVIWIAPASGEMMEPGPAMMNEYGQGENTGPQSPKELQQSMYRQMMEKYGSQWGMMEDPGLGPGMMLNYYGMHPGMMQGFGMMHRYGMRPGGMGGFGPGPGMMGGSGFCRGPAHMWNYQSEEYNTFMEATKETRKKLHDLQFEYGEMMRNPKTTMQELRDKEKDMYELQNELRKKALEQ